MVTYDTPMKGQKYIQEVKEQIQEDIMTYMNPLLDNDYELTNLNVDDLCQIIVDNFKTLEK